MIYNVKDAPIDSPILVWVADTNPMTKKPEGWKMGRCVHWLNKGKKLYANGYQGDWVITGWRPLPPDPIFPVQVRYKKVR